MDADKKEWHKNGVLTVTTMAAELDLMNPTYTCITSPKSPI
jgi:hypothetical protein